MDAATGATLQTYDQTTAAQEIYWSGGALFVVMIPLPKQWAIWENYYNTRLCLNTPSTNWNDHARVLTAINPTNGAVLWTNPATVYPTSIAVDSTGLVFHDGTYINKLDRNDGRLLLAILNSGYGLRSDLYGERLVNDSLPGHRPDGG